MIYLLTGENSFAIERELKRLADNFEGTVEKIDPADIELRNLPDLLMGATLFSPKRCIIIKQLSENKTIWNELPEWFKKVSDDTTLVLVESKPDRRTRTYKDLQKLAEVKNFPAWTVKDTSAAVKWAQHEAAAHNLILTDSLARQLVQRCGVDPWRLYHAIEKLSLIEKISSDIIAEVVDAHPEENVFGLLETALRGDGQAVRTTVATLKQTEDPYRVFGLLSSQILQLAALVFSDKSPSDVVRELKAAPFVLSKLAPFASRMTQVQAQATVRSAAKTDMLMKSSGVEPWLLVEGLLMKIAHER